MASKRRRGRKTPILREVLELAAIVEGGEKGVSTASRQIGISG